MHTFELSQSGDCFAGRFRAMANPCEILIATENAAIAKQVVALCQHEALRIEYKYSRYRHDSVIQQINTTHSIQGVDLETADLLDFAAHCHDISNGLFDITSGVLRRVWQFDGSNKIPNQHEIDDVLTMVGWQKLSWQRPYLVLPQGMEIDFGGIAKEYAVDRCVHRLRDEFCINELDDKISCLVNFGGDIAITGRKNCGTPWIIGVDKFDESRTPVIELYAGAVATSGDAYRYLLHQGIRYSHILNPKTGWPVKQAPNTVTVTAPTCSEAGILSTLAVLQGSSAERFLRQQNVKFWCHFADEFNR